MVAAVGDILRLTATFQWAAQDFFTNNYYVKLTTQDTSTDDAMMDAIALHFDAMYTNINAKISASVNYVDIQGQNITQDILLPTKAWPVLTSGGDAGHALPTQVAALVFFRTLRPKTRASVYLPPLGEASSDSGGVIVAATVTALQSFGDDWVAGILELTVEADYGAYNPALARFTQVEAAVVPARFRTQRRRRLGVGS